MEIGPPVPEKIFEGFYHIGASRAVVCVCLCVCLSVNIFKYLRNQWGGGKNALGFKPDQIGTLVSMATDSSHKVKVG